MCSGHLRNTCAVRGQLPDDVYFSNYVRFAVCVGPHPQRCALSLLLRRHRCVPRRWQQQWRTGIRVFCVCNYGGGRRGGSVGRPRPARVKRLTQAAPRRLTDGPARRRYGVGGGRDRITKGGAPPDGCGARGHSSCPTTPHVH